MILNPVRNALRHQSAYVCRFCLLKAATTACWQQPIRNGSARVIVPTLSPAVAAALHNTESEKRSEESELKKESVVAKSDPRTSKQKRDARIRAKALLKKAAKTSRKPPDDANEGIQGYHKREGTSGTDEPADSVSTTTKPAEGTLSLRNPRKVLSLGKGVKLRQVASTLAIRAVFDGKQAKRASNGKEDRKGQRTASNLSEKANLSTKKVVRKASSTAKEDIDVEAKPRGFKAEVNQVDATEFKISPIPVEQPPVPSLAYGLERVLFNPGVYHLQDPRSRVYNFDPYLQTIMPAAEFDFGALKEYITSSRDTSLKSIAKEHGKRYVGSTSSMTGVLAQFHFLLSQWREINTSMVSRGFSDKLKSFTLIQRSPTAIFLKWEDGTYAIDADKEFATANILSMLGKSMEKLLTLKTEDFERYRKSSSQGVPEEETNAREAFHYSTMGDFLMRSQLDAYDHRLPGTGMFDLKTRAVVTVRMDTKNPERGSGYEIQGRLGNWESYEREYYDMMRSAFLKYSLQVRMGRMDGIFVAFHNTERIFGFQYVSLGEMDLALHGQSDTTLGDQEFKVSLDLLNKILDRATQKFPKQSIRIHFETRDAVTPFMYIFAEPVTEEQVEELQNKNSAKIEVFERELLGLPPKDAEENAEEKEDQWEDIQAKVEEAMECDERGDESVAESRGIEAASEDDHHASASAEDGEEEEDEDDSVEDDERDEEDSEEEESEEEESENEEIEAVEAPEEESQKELKVEGSAECAFGEGQVDEAPQAIGEDAVEAVMEEEHELGALQEGLKVKEGHEAEGIPGEEEVEHSQEEDHKNSEAPDPNLQQSEVNHLQAQSSSLLSDFGTSLKSALTDSTESSTADPTFMNEIDTEKPSSTTPKPPLLAMTLTIRNKVDGKYILRPQNITTPPLPMEFAESPPEYSSEMAEPSKESKPSAKWTVEYTLTDITNHDRAWTLYEACQQRRKKMLDRDEENDAEREDDYYFRLMRELNEKGRQYRKETDKREGGQEKIVLGWDNGNGGEGK